jgi:hypothetical protein
VASSMHFYFDVRMMCGVIDGWLASGAVSLAHGVVMRGGGNDSRGNSGLI